MTFAARLHPPPGRHQDSFMMEDLSADDDILSDILLDTLEFEPAISTHKMNPNYRGQRFDRSTVSQIVRRRVVMESDIGAAIEDLSKLGVVQKYLTNKTSRQTVSFQAHARRYLETYLPDSGVEFALTMRYKRVMLEKATALAKKNGTLEPEKVGEPSTEVIDNRPKGKGKGRSSLDRASASIGAAPATASSKADLCVLAMRDFKVGDLVTHCKGGLKDLTKAEDDALREEAAMSREIRREAQYKGVLGPGRDFSVISSSRKGCSQLLLGPARFVNHDCNPNSEFYRLGPQMIFKIIRPVARNEEITTYYGDNYFEWANSECMCATCESRGQGAFADLCQKVEDEAEAKEDGDASGEQSGRRSSRRSTAGSARQARHSGFSLSGLPSPSPTPSTSATGSIGTPDTGAIPDSTSDRKMAAATSPHEPIDPLLEGQGPKCKCLTCGAIFWAPEKWWTPDECPRCERHYKIFKADWPERIPTEGSLSKKALGKRRAEALASMGSPLATSIKVAQPDSPTVATPTSGPKKRGRPPKGAAAESVDLNSGPDTPIKLSPMRSLGPAGTGRPPVASTAARRTSIGSTKAGAASREADEKEIDRSLQSVRSNSKRSVSVSSDASSHKKLPGSSKQYATLHRGAPSPTKSLQLDSDDSDLTPESESEEEEQPKSSSALAMSNGSPSSSNSPAPAGPKMLGKDARTDLLAVYWGAPTGDKRARRKSGSNGPTLLAAQRAKLQAAGAKSSHKRSASVSKTGEQPRKRASSSSSSDSDEEVSAVPKRSHRKKVLSSSSDHDDEEGKSGTPSSLAWSHRKTSSMSDLSGIMRGAKDAKSTSPIPALTPAKRSHKKMVGDVDDNVGFSPAAVPPSKTNGDTAVASAGSDSRGSPAAHAIPGLATKGVERTSESNLALFWSAGVEGGRTRRQTQREPTIVSSSSGSSQPPLKKTRIRSESGASRSNTPEAKRPRGRPPKAKSSENEDSTPSKDGAMDIDDEDDGDVDGNGSDRSSKTITPQARAERSTLVKSEKGASPSVGGGKDAFPSSTSIAAHPLLPAAPLMRPPAFVRQPPESLVAAARGHSPLSGPPPTAALPRGAVPGQPIRRNLRWGSGKTSMSRPLGTTSPLGRPPPAPGASPTHAIYRPGDGARALTYGAQLQRSPTLSHALTSTPPVATQPYRAGQDANGSPGTVRGSSESDSPNKADADVPPTKRERETPEKMRTPPPSFIKTEVVEAELPLSNSPPITLPRPALVPSAPQLGGKPSDASPTNLSRAESQSKIGLDQEIHGSHTPAPEGVFADIKPGANSEAPAQADGVQSPPVTPQVRPKALEAVSPADKENGRDAMPPPKAASVNTTPASAVSSKNGSPSGAPPSASPSGGETLSRRLSGRARKPPEMAAGQIQYKGSLIKLAAKRAKEAQANSGVTGNAGSNVASPGRTPPPKRRKSASTSPSKLENVTSADTAAVGNGDRVGRTEGAEKIALESELGKPPSTPVVKAVTELEDQRSETVTIESPVPFSTTLPNGKSNCQATTVLVAKPGFQLTGNATAVVDENRESSINRASAPATASSTPHAIDRPLGGQAWIETKPPALAQSQQPQATVGGANGQQTVQEERQQEPPQQRHHHDHSQHHHHHPLAPLRSLFMDR
ncbi:hypothetical protein IE53DRAFT_43686 [Violaceomyces palustris]|uniref:Uncharacterized protein n=1 Tax=Violaceomyces palustris TaxID=1673888 RepID=A0ACD0P0S8_9BASI|nr:hypothetical protein IE53DRAFT_43686 [Violaceomyces palustris]